MRLALAPTEEDPGGTVGGVGVGEEDPARVGVAGAVIKRSCASVPPSSSR